MSYHDYQEMMARVDGTKGPATREELAKAGIEVRDYRRDVKNEQWNGTLYLKDGKPVKFSFYVWKAELDDVVKYVSEDLGYPVTFGEVCHAGNGHFSAELVRKNDSMEWQAPTGLDPECEKLCVALNGLPGIKTSESCCGHGESPFVVFMEIDTTQWGHKYLSRCASKRYSPGDWRVRMSHTDVEPFTIFVLWGPADASAGDEFAGRIERALLHPKVRKLFGAEEKKCRYDDCAEQNQVVEGGGQVTCPTCRKELGLPPL